MLSQTKNTNTALMAPAANSRRPRSSTIRAPVAPPFPLHLIKKPHVVVLGNKRVAKQVCRALESEDIVVLHCVSIDRAEIALTNSTTAVIIVPPLTGGALASTCARFTKHRCNAPVFVACGPSSEKTLSGLYKIGVAAVFVWPLDRAPLVRTVFRIARRTRPSKKKRSSQEIALQEVVASHLRTEVSTIGRRLQVRVMKRYVMLSGHVDALWQVKVAESIAAAVPGVEDVFPDAVLVSGSPDLSDRGIANSVRQVLKHTSSVDSSTLSVSVKTGVATLAGSVSSRNELERVVDLISHTRGVVKIEDWAVVTAGGQRKDHLVVKAVRAAVALRFPRGKIDVAVFGGVAVLSGKVRNSTERRDVGILVSRQRGVQRVVDKLRVAGVGRTN